MRWTNWPGVVVALVLLGYMVMMGGALLAVVP